MTRPPADHTAQEANARRDGKITRNLVLTTALEIIDRDGADGLSMRRLARALDRDPMILYRHAPNKAALMDGVVLDLLAACGGGGGGAAADAHGPVSVWYSGQRPAPPRAGHGQPRSRTWRDQRLRVGRPGP
jgi:hypothetical protein